jgi:predicted AlkP superfamily phosphohydrolase/phosphomutase
MSTGKSKTIVVGMEMGDGRFLYEWANSGRLPFLKSLIDRGCWGWLESTADRLHISAWPSIYTGASPGDHGIYFTFQPAPGLQGYQRFRPGLYGRPTFWQLLSGAGRECAVFDPPYSHPESGFKGRYIYDWGSWAHYLQTGSVPDGLLQQLQKSCGGYPLGLEAHTFGWKSLDPAAISARLIAATRAKASATCWLMQQSEWDLAFTVFGETHVAGHYCLLTDSTGVAAEQRPLLDLYQELDRSIEKIYATADVNTTIIVISGDCVARNHAGWHLLPDILARLGYLADGSVPPVAAADAAAPPAKRFDPVKVLRDLLPKEFRKNLAGLLPTALRDKLAQRVDNANIDWSRTRAYCLPTDLEGYIRINLKGREPLGIVEPGAEYATLQNELAQALSELRDPVSGQSIVREVIRTDNAFPGDRRAYLPDLIVRWNAERPISCACSAGLGTVSKLSPDPRPGTHAGPGFVLAAGPGIVPGQLPEAAHIFDFAPTLLTRLRVAVPAHMHGRVWPELTVLTEGA